MDNITKHFLKSMLTRFGNKEEESLNKIKFGELNTEPLIQSVNNIDTKDEMLDLKEENVEESPSSKMTNEESSSDSDSFRDVYSYKLY